MKPNHIKGEIFNKDENYWLCDFEWKNDTLIIKSEYQNGNWESINKPVKIESLEYLK